MFAQGHVDVYTDADPFAGEKLGVSQKQIKQIVVNEISSGQVKCGEKVPSIRVLSAKFGVSQAIIRRAFAQLLAEGWLEMRHGSGTYVSNSSKVLISATQDGVELSNEIARTTKADARQFGIPGIPAIPAIPAKGELQKGEIESTRWQRDLLKAFDGTQIYGLGANKHDLNFLTGCRPQNLPRGARWDTAIDRWKTDCVRAAGVTDPAGMLELRHEIADWLRRAKGMTCTMNDIIIVNGAQEARSLLARLLIDRGTKLVHEEPGSVFNRLLFQSFGAEIIPVSVDESGPIMDELNATGNARLMYVTPVAQFPTGAVFSRSRKQRILEWAKSKNAIVIEDESTSEFIYESRISPSIAAQDTESRTVYIGGFSQMLPSEWQVAFIVAPRAFQIPLLRMKSLTDRCTPFVVQALTRRLLESGFVQEYTRRLQRQNDERRLCMLASIDAWNDDDIAYSPVKGGSSQTIWFRPGIDDVKLVQACYQQGIAVTPVSPCFMRQPSQSGLVLNFAGIDADEMNAAMSRLHRVLRQLI